MEGLSPLHRRVAGIDVHRMPHVAAALILIEIGDDMARFGSPERLACWAALSLGNNESAGKRKSGRIGHGHNTVRCVLCKCAAMSAKKNAPRWIKQLIAIGKWPAPSA